MRAISLPFRIDGYGRVAATSDRNKINADRVRSALMTSLGERTMRLRFGSVLTQLMFASFDEVIESAEDTVVMTFSEFLPDLTFESLEVSFEDPENGELQIEITYRDVRRLNEADAQYVQVNLIGGTQ